MKPDLPLTEQAFQFQTEMREFLDLFPWQENIPLGSFDSISVCDVGARTFILAPVIEECLEGMGFKPTIHGVEIDPFRRYTNLHTRADYGHFYASKVKDGHYHGMDFLNWKVPMDLILMLNPFVTEEPHLNWGLPLKTFSPYRVFEHASKIVSERVGLLLLSSPDDEEFEVADQLARQVGFDPINKATWNPTEFSLQRKPRIGGLYKKRNLK